MIKQSINQSINQSFNQSIFFPSANMESLKLLDLTDNMLTKFPVEIFHMPELEEVFVG